MDTFIDLIHSLPDALDDKQQEVLLRRYYATRDEKARKILLDHNLRLVVSCILKNFQLGIDPDEQLAVGTMELINVLDNKYDITKGIKFSTFAYKSIRGVLMCMSRDKRASSDVLDTNYLPEEFYFNDSLLNRFEAIPDDSNWEEEILSDDKINRILDTLDEDERYIVIHKYGLFGNKIYSTTEIAKSIGLTKQAVSLKAKAAEYKLKQYYYNEGKSTYSEDMRVILEYLENTDNEKHKKVLEMYYGLNGREKVKQADIAKEMGVQSSYVRQVINMAKYNKDVTKYTFVDAEDIEKAISLSTKDRETTIAELYYGLNGNEKMELADIAQKLNLPYEKVNKTMWYLQRKIKIAKQKEARGEKVLRLSMDQIMDYYNNEATEQEKELIDYKYGLNGRERKSSAQLAEIYNIATSSATRKYTRLDKKIKSYLMQDDFNM